MLLNEKYLRFYKKASENKIGCTFVYLSIVQISVRVKYILIYFILKIQYWNYLFLKFYFSAGKIMSLLCIQYSYILWIKILEEQEKI